MIYLRENICSYPMMEPVRQHNVQHTMRLEEAMNIALNAMEQNIFDNLDNNFPYLTRLYKDLIRLQATIMFRGVNDVREFLVHYLNVHGPEMTEVLVNAPFYEQNYRETITPLTCACLWSSNPEMIRVLYEYGANVSQADQYGLFPEEHYYLPYFNHLAPYMTNHNIQPNFNGSRRFMADFYPVRDEIEVLAGERPPPENWAHPIILIQN